MSIVTAGDIEILRSDMRRNNFLISKALLNFAQVVLQTQTKLRSLGQPDGQTLAHLVGEHEEFHLLSDLAVVALLCLFEHDEVFVEHLLFGERDAVEALHLLAGSVATPEGSCHGGQLDGLDLARVHQVRTTAEVGERSLRVG